MVDRGLSLFTLLPRAGILGNHLGQTWQLTEWLCTAGEYIPPSRAVAGLRRLRGGVWYLGRFRRHDRTSALLVETVVRALMEQLLFSIITGLPTQWASAPPIRNV